MKRIKLVAFDIYGTLVEVRTWEDAYRVWKTLKEVIYAKADIVCHMSSEELKNSFFRIRNEEQENQKRYYGEWAEVDEVKVFKNLLLEISDNEAKVERVAKDVAVIFRTLCRSELRIYDGVENTLRKLKEKGYRLGILSNAQTPYVEMELGSLFPYFEKELIFISSEHRIKKPDKEFYQKMLDTAGVPAEQAVMVGNSFKDDIFPAQNLGIHGIYVNSDLIQEELPKEVAGVISPQGFEELLTILNNL